MNYFLTNCKIDRRRGEEDGWLPRQTSHGTKRGGRKKRWQEEKFGRRLIKNTGLMHQHHPLFVTLDETCSRACTYVYICTYGRRSRAVCVCCRNKGRLITLSFALLPLSYLPSVAARASYDFHENFWQTDGRFRKISFLIPLRL